MVDPVFAAVESHRKLDHAYMKLAREADSISGNSDVDRASEAAQTAVWKMARTKPTTAAGAAAMLEYIAFGYCIGLFDLGETDWHETAFRTVVAALDKIARPRSLGAADLLAAVRTERARRQKAA